MKVARPSAAPCLVGLLLLAACSGPSDEPSPADAASSVDAAASHADARPVDQADAATVKVDAALPDASQPQTDASQPQTDAAALPPDARTADAEPPAVCGDGQISGGETCDDGNQVSEPCAYGETACQICDSACRQVAGATSYCGDNRIDAANGEICDDGDQVDLGNGCDASCHANAVCGDGKTQGLFEDCDDGNSLTEACAYGQTSCTVCDGTCHQTSGVVSYCGDASIDAANGEQCDDGNSEVESCAQDEATCTVCGGGCQLVAGTPVMCEGNGCIASWLDCCGLAPFCTGGQNAPSTACSQTCGSYLSPCGDNTDCCHGLGCFRQAIDGVNRCVEVPCATDGEFCSPDTLCCSHFCNVFPEGTRCDSSP